VTGPTGPPGEGGGASAGACGPLKAGEQEAGEWSDTINVAPGGYQEQTQGAISYPCSLGQEEEIHVAYVTEGELSASGGIHEICEGTANEPVAEVGFLCVFNFATATVGNKEKEYKEAEFFALMDSAGTINFAKGEISTPPETKAQYPTSKSKIGELVVFRTKVFSVTGTPTTLAKAATSNAAGSWAVREEK